MNEGFFSSPRREEGANRDSQPTSNAGIGKKTRSLHKFSREAAESSWFSKKSEYVICKADYTRPVFGGWSRLPRMILPAFGSKGRAPLGLAADRV
jgi:hypothetical protein